MRIIIQGNFKDFRWQKYKPRYYRDESEIPETLTHKIGYNRKNYVSFGRRPSKPVYVVDLNTDEIQSMKRLRIIRAVLGIFLTLVILAGIGTLVYIRWGEEIYSRFFEKKTYSLEEETSKVTNIGNEEAITYDKETGLAIYGNEFNLQIISASYPADETFTVDTMEIGGVQVDKRIADALSLMLSDAEADGVDIELVSGYISYEEQKELFDAEVARLEKKGTTKLMSEYTASQSIAKPGEADAQTGLSVVVKNVNKTDFTRTSVYRWLNENAVDYGFVFRFPDGDAGFTGRQADLTVIRYVGRDNALKMRQLSMCLEEYSLYIYSK